MNRFMFLLLALSMGQTSFGRDYLEPNNSQYEAKQVHERRYDNLDLGSTPDWYKVYVPQGKTLEVQIDFDQSRRDLFIVLKRDNRTVGVSRSSYNRKRVSADNTQVGYYYIMVGGNGYRRTNYDLIIDINETTTTQPINNPHPPNPSVGPAPLETDRFEPNDHQSQAQTLKSGEYHNLTIRGSVDWYKVNVQEGDSLNVQVLFQNRIGDLDLSIHDERNELKDSDSQTDNEQIELQRLSAGTYYIKVEGYSHAKNSYKLVIQIKSAPISPDIPAEPDQPITPSEEPTGEPVVPTTPQPPTMEVDRFEPNNSQEEATLLVSGFYPDLTLDKQPDWYKITVKAGGSVRAQIEFNHNQGDLDLFLFNQTDRIERSESQTGSEYISRGNLEPGDYYLLVQGYEAAQNGYTLKLEVSDFTFPELLTDSNDN